MERLHAHVYTVVCAAAGILLVVGAVIIKQHLPAQTTTTLRAWGSGSEVLINASSYQPQNPVLANLPPPTGDSPSFSAIPVSKPVSTAPAEETNDEIDNNTFASALNLSPRVTNTSKEEANGTAEPSYSFIPTAFTPQNQAPERTEAEQALFQYGNDVGSYIQSYEDAHSNVTVILRDQALDRQNAQKGQAVKDIGGALTALGESLEGMDEVPSAVAGMHHALAQAYKTLGQKLSQIPDAPGDEAFIATINAYNSAADDFTKEFIGLATYFSLSGIKFGTIDPGNIFMFSGSAGI